MSPHRIATLGRPGPAWPRAVARWGSTATLPLDTTTCVTAEELHALVTTAPVSLAIVEAGLPGVDRTLAAGIRRSGAGLAVVDGPGLAGAALSLDPDAVLDAGFGPGDLDAVLRAHARRRTPIADATPEDETGTVDPLVAVTGTGGTGASTIAQALAAHAARRAPTVLADLALDGDQHVRHGADPGQDGLFELAEAVRHRPSREVNPVTTSQAAGYDLLRGLRRRQEWTVLSAPGAEQVVDALRRRWALTVADVDAEIDGRDETGSVDLEEHNALARAVLHRADTVVVVGRCSTTGVHRLVRALLDLRHHGLDPARLRPVLNEVHGPGWGRSSGRALAGLLHEIEDGPWAPAVALPHDRAVEPAVREARPLPARFVARVGRAVPLP